MNILIAPARVWFELGLNSHLFDWLIFSIIISALWGCFGLFAILNVLRQMVVGEWEAKAWAKALALVGVYFAPLAF